ncbi:hypothetical protein [Clostridium sp. MD294]|uniref:hypothetical protein n=1 Tax=Clostridium sp. MD294 TaxID=97138 RepID=UPI0002CB7E1D|nr:hypothetical protein [Clostridium sp. MD294]NDO45440.1 transcriptional regulator [Clostridium sp. MD294]USF30914.1 hypothetical protein C820_002358 [Clostridium sp. MD294]
MRKEKIHQPYNKFKGFLKEKELTYSDVGKVLNISVTAVLNKINGVSDFYVEEVKTLQSKYGMELSVFFN